jgi:uncharacterized paraquat-inducible protein A
MKISKQEIKEILESEIALVELDEHPKVCEYCKELNHNQNTECWKCEGKFKL